MKITTCHILVAAVVASFAAGASAQSKPIGCNGRTIPAALQDGKINPNVLLDAAMKGRTFEYTQNASVVGTEAMLIQYYGMRLSLRSIPSESDRAAVARVAHLMQNNFVIAGQMALGATTQSGTVPPMIQEPLAKYVTNATEPFHGDDELTTISENLKKANDMIAPMTEKPRVFARWVVKAAAFDDSIAYDAALSALCMSEPTAADLKVLKSAFDIAKIDRNKKFRDPAIFSGALPDLNKSHKH